MKMIQPDRVRSFRFWNKATPMTVKSQTVAQMVKVSGNTKKPTADLKVYDKSSVEWENN